MTEDELLKLPFPRAAHVARDKFARKYVQHYVDTHATFAQAARAAGLDRSNFRRLMKKLGVKPKEHAPLEEYAPSMVQVVRVSHDTRCCLVCGSVEHTQHEPVGQPK